MKRTALTLLVTAGLFHCTGGPDNVAPPKPTRGDGGTIELPPPPPPPDNCDVTKLPTETPCVIHESVGVFVSLSKGRDDGLGTRESPLKDVSKAIEGAAPTGRRVYVCAETYEAPLKLADGISVFGYFDCIGADWKVIEARAKVAPREGVAATAKGIVKPTRIEALDIVSADGKGPGDSSIAFVAQDASGVSFVNTRIAAGKGRDGVDGKAAIQLFASGVLNGAPALREDNCNLDTTCPAQHAVNRPGGKNTCTGAPGHDGGPGGDGGKTTEYRKRGARDGFGNCSLIVLSGVGQCFVPQGTAETGFPKTATAMTAAGATMTAAAQPGAAGKDGIDGPNGVGVLSAEGYKAGDGTPGTDGEPGQGGGGGSSRGVDDAMNVTFAPYSWWGTSGGGGGAGGCPGLAGGAGTGGGASIAVLAVRSPMHFDAKSVVASTAAGRGGAGTNPSSATNGGSAGGNTVDNYPFVVGAAGGRGGGGGRSGSGASGPSFGIAWTGARPVVETTPTVGPPASPPAAGLPAGVVEPVHEF